MGMSDSSKQRYALAVELYHESQFQDALKLLDDLARERPDSRHIIYYRALCLVALDRIDEARSRMEELSSFKDSSSKELHAKLEAKLSPMLKARKKQRAVEEAIRALESDGHYDKPPRRKLKYAAMACVTLPVIVIAAYVIQGNSAPMSESAGVYAAAVQNAPDQYLEVSTFMPALMEQPMTFIVVMAPSGGMSQRTETELNGKVGQPLFEEWDDVRGHLQSALRLARQCTDPIPGVDGAARTGMVQTLVLPRAGTPLPENIAAREPETFSPGAATNLSTLVTTCGEADHSETWVGAARTAGISGKTHWWGNIGVAAEANGDITHVLVRTYPQEEAPAPQAQ